MAFTYRLEKEDGTPADPPCFTRQYQRGVSATRFRSVITELCRDPFVTPRRGRRRRALVFVRPIEGERIGDDHTEAAAHPSRVRVAEVG